MRILLICILGITLFAGCESKPKVIEIGQVNTEGVKDLNNDDPTAGVAHQVVVAEVLNTDKYTYLNVKEGEKMFWIAIPLSEVAVGENLVFRGGLLKRNFESREFNRIFETLYLVSDIQRAASAATQGSEKSMPDGHPQVAPPVHASIKPAEGAIAISTLLKNKAKYDGQIVRITGKCMKINPMIMNRNWIHIQDGTADNYDLTITTAELIPVGHVVTFEGKVALNKDFGAGYRYDLIIEDAILLH